MAVRDSFQSTAAHSDCGAIPIADARLYHAQIHTAPQQLYCQEPIHESYRFDPTYFAPNDCLSKAFPWGPEEDRADRLA